MSYNNLKSVDVNLIKWNKRKGIFEYTYTHARTNAHTYPVLLTKTHLNYLV